MAVDQARPSTPTLVAECLAVKTTLSGCGASPRSAMISSASRRRSPQDLFLRPRGFRRKPASPARRRSRAACGSAPTFGRGNTLVSSSRPTWVGSVAVAGAARKASTSRVRVAKARHSRARSSRPNLAVRERILVPAARAASRLGNAAIFCERARIIIRACPRGRAHSPWRRAYRPRTRLSRPAAR